MQPTSVSKIPLMPKSTAIWLIENTTLTLTQIAEFCGFHELEIQAIADEESTHGMMGVSPIVMGQLTQEEIERCQRDTTQKLHIHEILADAILRESVRKKDASNKGGRYTPRARRGDRPDAIAWILKQCPSITDAEVIRLVGTTKPTIEAIRNRTHWNMTNIKPRSPAVLGFCVQEELDKVIHKHLDMETAKDLLLKE